MSTPVEALFDKVKWEPIDGAGEIVDGDTPYATHAGILNVAGIEFRCYQLSNGERVVDAEDFQRAFSVYGQE